MYYVVQRSQGDMLEFVYLVLFERTRRGVLDDAEMRILEDTLLANPRAGAVIVNTSGVRKVRAAQQERGKSGSARVVYLYVEDQATIYFILAFPKNVQGTLTPDQKRQVRALVVQLKQEDWPRSGVRHVSQAN